MDYKKVRAEALKLGYAIAMGKKNKGSASSTMAYYPSAVTTEEVIEEAEKLVSFMEGW